MSTSNKDDKIVDLEVLCIDVEVNDKVVEEDQLTPEQKAANDEFTNRIKADCQSWMIPCNCPQCTAKYMGLANRTYTLTGKPRPITLDDMKDFFKFYPLVHMKNGVREGAFTVVRECTFCHNLQLYGSGMSLGILLATLDTFAINSGAIDAGQDSTTGLDILKDTEMVPIDGASDPDGDSNANQGQFNPDPPSPSVQPAPDPDPDPSVAEDR